MANAKLRNSLQFSLLTNASCAEVAKAQDSLQQVCACHHCSAGALKQLRFSSAFVWSSESAVRRRFQAQPVQRIKFEC